MKKITTIDLWTEQYPNHYECFNGAFVDGFENGNIPFDECPRSRIPGRCRVCRALAGGRGRRDSQRPGGATRSSRFPRAAPRPERGLLPYG